MSPDFPEKYIVACEEGVLQALKSGTIGGYEVVDTHVELIDAIYQDEHSTEAIFKTTSSLALTNALKKGNPILLEPIFKIEVTVPELYIGEVIGDIAARNGTLIEMEAIPGKKLIRATVPLSNLFGYATDLRSKTQGRGHYSMIFNHFDQVLQNRT